jgi:hypothetical protein
MGSSKTPKIFVEKNTQNSHKKSTHPPQKVFDMDYFQKVFFGVFELFAEKRTKTPSKIKN